MTSGMAAASSGERLSVVGAVVVLALFALVGESDAGDAGHWMTGAPAPTARTEVAAAEMDGWIYVVGGFEPRSVWTFWQASVSARVEAYHPATNQWAAKPDLPVGLHHAGAVAVDGALFVIGGFVQSDDTTWRPSDRVWRFDAERGAWEERAPLPTARGGLAVTTLRGKVFAVGGYDGRDNSAAVEVFDPARDQWASAAPLPTPRDHLAVVVLDDALYAIGGRVRLDYRNNLSVVEVFDADRDQWAAKADMPTPRSGIAADAVDEWIYVFGGESGDGTFPHNERYSPRLNRWQAMAPMPTARHGLGAVAVDGRVYVLSGGPRPGGSYSALNEIFIPPAPSRSTTSGRAPPAHIGSVMALLAVAHEAGVLPPESGPEVDQLIHALIQSQSALLNGADPGARDVLTSALSAKFGTRRAAALTGAFRSTGWTSETLESLVEYAARRSPREELRWADVVRNYNVTAADWELVERMFLKTREHLRGQGRDIHAVFASHRASLPGGQPAP